MNSYKNMSLHKFQQNKLLISTFPPPKKKNMNKCIKNTIIIIKKNNFK